MSDLTPYALSCGLVCIWPLLLGFLGFLIGARKLRSPIRIQNPFRQQADDPVGYAPREGRR